MRKEKSQDDSAGLAESYAVHSTVDDNVDRKDVPEPEAPTVLRSVRLSPDMMDRLDAFAAAQGVEPGDLLSTWINERLSVEHGTAQPAVGEVDAQQQYDSEPELRGLLGEALAAPTAKQIRKRSSEHDN